MATSKIKRAGKKIALLGRRSRRPSAGKIPCSESYMYPSGYGCASDTNEFVPGKPIVESSGLSAFDTKKKGKEDEEFKAPLDKSSIIAGFVNSLGVTETSEPTLTIYKKPIQEQPERPEIVEAKESPVQVVESDEVPMDNLSRYKAQCVSPKLHVLPHEEPGLRSSERCPFLEEDTIPWETSNHADDTYLHLIAAQLRKPARPIQEVSDDRPEQLVGSAGTAYSKVENTSQERVRRELSQNIASAELCIGTQTVFSGKPAPCHPSDDDEVSLSMSLVTPCVLAPKGAVSNTEEAGKVETNDKNSDDTTQTAVPDPLTPVYPVSPSSTAVTNPNVTISKRLVSTNNTVVTDSREDKDNFAFEKASAKSVKLCTSSKLFSFGISTLQHGEGKSSTYPPISEGPYTFTITLADDLRCPVACQHNAQLHSLFCLSPCSRILAAPLLSNYRRFYLTLTVCPSLTRAELSYDTYRVSAFIGCFVNALKQGSSGFLPVPSKFEEPAQIAINGPSHSEVYDQGYNFLRALLPHAYNASGTVQLVLNGDILQTLLQFYHLEACHGHTKEFKRSVQVYSVMCLAFRELHTRLVDRPESTVGHKMLSPVHSVNRALLVPHGLLTRTHKWLVHVYLPEVCEWQSPPVYKRVQWRFMLEFQASVTLDFLQTAEQLPVLQYFCNLVLSHQKSLVYSYSAQYDCLLNTTAVALGASVFSIFDIWAYLELPVHSYLANAFQIQYPRLPLVTLGCALDTHQLSGSRFLPPTHRHYPVCMLYDSTSTTEFLPAVSLQIWHKSCLPLVRTALNQCLIKPVAYTNLTEVCTQESSSALSLVGKPVQQTSPGQLDLKDSSHEGVQWQPPLGHKAHHTSYNLKGLLSNTQLQVLLHFAFCVACQQHNVPNCTIYHPSTIVISTAEQLKLIPSVANLVCSYSAQYHCLLDTTTIALCASVFSILAHAFQIQYPRLPLVTLGCAQDTHQLSGSSFLPPTPRHYPVCMLHDSTSTTGFMQVVGIQIWHISCLPLSLIKPVAYTNLPEVCTQESSSALSLVGKPVQQSSPGQLDLEGSSHESVQWQPPLGHKAHHASYNLEGLLSDMQFLVLLHFACRVAYQQHNVPTCTIYHPSTIVISTAEQLKPIPSVAHLVLFHRNSSVCSYSAQYHCLLDTTTIALGSSVFSILSHAFQIQYPTFPLVTMGCAWDTHPLSGSRFLPPTPRHYPVCVLHDSTSTTDFLPVVGIQIWLKSCFPLVHTALSQCLVKPAAYTNLPEESSSPLSLVGKPVQQTSPGQLDLKGSSHENVQWQSTLGHKAHYASYNLKGLLSDMQFLVLLHFACRVAYQQHNVPTCTTYHPSNVLMTTAEQLKPLLSVACPVVKGVEWPVVEGVYSGVCQIQSFCPLQPTTTEFQSLADLAFLWLSVEGLIMLKVLGCHILAQITHVAAAVLVHLPKGNELRVWHFDILSQYPKHVQTTSGKKPLHASDLFIPLPVILSSQMQAVARRKQTVLPIMIQVWPANEATKSKRGSCSPPKNTPQTCEGDRRKDTWKTKPISGLIQASDHTKSSSTSTNGNPRAADSEAGENQSECPNDSGDGSRDGNNNGQDAGKRDKDNDEGDDNEGSDRRKHKQMRKKRKKKKKSCKKSKKRGKKYRKRRRKLIKARRRNTRDRRSTLSLSSESNAEESANRFNTTPHVPLSTEGSQKCQGERTVISSEGIRASKDEWDDREDKNEKGKTRNKRKRKNNNRRRRKKRGKKYRKIWRKPYQPTRRRSRDRSVNVSSSSESSSCNVEDNANIKSPEPISTKSSPTNQGRFADGSGGHGLRIPSHSQQPCSVTQLQERLPSPSSPVNSPESHDTESDVSPPNGAANGSAPQPQHPNPSLPVPPVVHGTGASSQPLVSGLPNPHTAFPAVVEHEVSSFITATIFPSGCQSVDSQHDSSPSVFQIPGATDGHELMQPRFRHFVSLAPPGESESQNRTLETPSGLALPTGTAPTGPSVVNSDAVVSPQLSPSLVLCTAGGELEARHRQSSSRLHQVLRRLRALLWGCCGIPVRVLCSTRELVEVQMNQQCLPFRGCLEALMYGDGECQRRVLLLLVAFIDCRSICGHNGHQCGDLDLSGAVVDLENDVVMVEARHLCSTTSSPRDFLCRVAELARTLLSVGDLPCCYVLPEVRGTLEAVECIARDQAVLIDMDENRLLRILRQILLIFQ